MKVFLISHIADLDGVMPVILTDLAFEEYDYHLLDIDEVDSYMLESLKNNRFDGYDKVFMTDICISEEVALKIDQLDFKEKFQVLDHHYTRLPLNRFSFIEVVDVKDGIHESGTSLYYKYLLKNYANQNLIKESVSYMVSLVRLGDTWEWKRFNVLEARDLGTLFAYYGNEKFINYYCSFLRKNKEFYFNEAEKMLIYLDRKKIESYVEEKKQELMKKEISGHTVGIVFAEQYRSELGNALAEYYQDEVDFIIIINVSRSISYRSVREDFSVADFAEIYGGGGHKQAAGSPLPADLKDKIIEYIFHIADFTEKEN